MHVHQNGPPSLMNSWVSELTTSIPTSRVFIGGFRSLLAPELKPLYLSRYIKISRLLLIGQLVYFWPFQSWTSRVCRYIAKLRNYVRCTSKQCPSGNPCLKCCVSNSDLLGSYCVCIDTRKSWCQSTMRQTLRPLWEQRNMFGARIKNKDYVGGATCWSSNSL